MDIDIYQPCPCNSGKKIKFCCAKDIVADLNQILSKSAANQSASAIDLIDRTVEKVGQRDCLSIIKTHILLSSNEIEKAEEVNKEFLSANPKHPIGWQHLALVKVGQQDMNSAVAALQKAMNEIDGNEIPVSFANAFRTVGSGLLAVGHLLAARAHFNYALMLKGSDEQTQGLLIETYRMGDVPMLLKHDFRLDQPPEEETPWRKDYVNAIRALDRGQFKFGMKILKKADAENPGVLQIKRGLAILKTNLAIDSEMGVAWREYSQTEGVSKWEAVEAEAMAQILGEDELCPEFDVVSVSLSLSDLATASEAAISNPRFVSHEVPPDVDTSQGPPPRFIFVVLDREELKEAEGLAIDTIPNVIGEMLMYGKQTDRDARIEFLATKNSKFDEAISYIQETFKTEIDGDAKETVLGQVSMLSDTLTWNWHLPQDVTREQYQDLNTTQRQKTMLEKWPEIPFNIFDNKTAREASKDEKYHIGLEALMIQLEQSSDQQVNGETITVELRKELGLPEPEMVDPETLGDRLVSPIRQKYLLIDKLSDEQLVAIQSEAMMIGNMGVLKRILPEILSRPSTNDSAPHDLCHSVLAQIAEEDEECFGHLAKAREIAKENDRPFGVYLVQELEMGILRGKTDKLPELLREIETNHLAEPNVEYQLVRVLQRFGLIGADGRPPGAPPQRQPAPAAAGAPGVWTGDDAPSEPQPDEAAPQESKLWIPGQ